MKSHLPLKVLLLAASALSPLLAAKILHVLAPKVAPGYAALLSGLPLPALTDAVLVRFAGSDLALGCGLTVTALIVLSVATLANPRLPADDTRHAWQLFLAFIGPFLALLYIGVALVAALLPLIAVTPGLSR